MAEAQLTNQLTRIDSMTNVELRGELKRRGCPTSGNKKDLLAKLRAALQKEYEQSAVEPTPTIDSISPDGRNNNNNNLSGLQQSPVIPFDVNRPLLNNSSTSSNSYMTPIGGSPMTYPQHMHTAEVPLTYNNLQIHDQTAGQYPPVYNLTMHQNVHQPPAPMIPIPQQLTISTSERQQIYHQSLLESPQQVQQQMTPMNTRRGRASVDAQLNTSISPTVSTSSPEKRSRSRSKKSSVDSQSNEIVEQQNQSLISLTSSTVESSPNPIVEATPVEQTIEPEPTIDNKLEVNPFVSKSNEEDQKELDKDREERGDSRSPSVGSSSAKSESVIKEIPLSGERHRLSRSKSPKSRWHHSPSPQEQEQDQQQQQQQQQISQPATIEEENLSATTTTNDDEKIVNEQTEKSSIVTLFAEQIVDLTANEKKPDEFISEKQEETIHKEEEEEGGTMLTDNQQPEQAAPQQQQQQQQLKPSRCQGSSFSSSSSLLMKGLNRSLTNNRMNLSSDVLKTLISDISLAPESVIETELDASENEQNNGDHVEYSPNQSMLETSVPTGFLFSDSMTIGELADQKQQRNRTVVIDLAVDSSSLNDDLVGHNSDIRKKTAAAPTRLASFESRALLDGKSNVVMMDEPIRVKDVTAAREPVSQIVYIRGLTRPFTLPQLKELLSRYGTFVDGQFWLDKIKSQCFVVYNTLDEAQNAREGLDGCRWPSTNPKTLAVRFGRQEEFDFSKTHDLSPDQMLIDAIDSTNKRLIQEKLATTNKPIPSSSHQSTNPIDETKTANKKARPTGNTAEVREWDLPKFQQDKEPIGNERQIIEEQQLVKSDEPPAKGLDDYFRKTKAKPAIYWLPLTDEQIIERTRRQEQRKAERDEEQRKRQLEENVRTSSSTKDSKSRMENNPSSSSNRPHRRSPSPKDKRKRVLSSTSPPRRDNKRH